jgi:hypothetical protein
MIPKEKFSCVENTESGGTQLWFNTEYDEPIIHVLGQWENGFRKEFVVCLDEAQLQEFKKQVAAL